MNEQTHEHNYLAVGRQVLKDEAAALLTLADNLDDNFYNSCQMIHDCSGRVVVCGIGKSGHVGRKIAASLASLGRPAFFLHAAEAIHGDVGMVTPQDVVILISHSGETQETVRLIPSLRRIGAKCIALTANANSTLAQKCDLTICTCVEQEADPLNLAPTTSALVTLAVGDALAVAVSACHGFTAEDFALCHPGGALGRRLLGEEAM